MERCFYRFKSRPITSSSRVPSAMSFETRLMSRSIPSRPIISSRDIEYSA
jgi:hypothetical protein